jgi:hypothetical protein
MHEFYVAGVKHHALPEVDPEDFESVSFLDLEKEPTNKYDGTAVKIIWNFEDKPYMLGYVPAKISAKVTNMIDENPDGVFCKVLEYNHFESPWKMLKVRIYHSQEV